MKIGTIFLLLGAFNTLKIEDEGLQQIMSLAKKLDMDVTEDMFKG